MNDPRGSIWRKWDLHVHTPFSAHQQFGNPKKVWDEYINKLEERAEEIGVRAIGVTDYFTIEGYKKLKEAQKKGRLQGLLILPNIELRLYGIIPGGQRLQYHIIFDDKVAVDTIEKEFLQKLDIKTETGDSRTCTRSNIEAIG